MNNVVGPRTVLSVDYIFSRIDAFCVLTCREIKIGKYVHVACFCSMSGPLDVIVEDFATISHGVHIFTGSDDYSGKSMVNPMVPEKFKDVQRGDVRIGRGAIIGAGCVIMPGVTIGSYAAVGALSFVKQDIPAFEIWGGVPAKFIKHRVCNVSDLEKEFLGVTPDRETKPTAA